MTTTLKSNDNLVKRRQARKREDANGNILLPLPPEEKNARAEMEIYARFMRHLRMVPNSQMEIKVLSAIQFTADMIDIGDALVAKTLIDLGLRAPRKAFPSSYLEFIDKSILRTGWQVGGPTKSAAELKLYWDSIGEDKFAAVRREVPTVTPSIFVET